VGVDCALLARGPLFVVSDGSSAPSPISNSPSVRSADQKRQTLPVASDEKGALSVARRRKR